LGGGLTGDAFIGSEASAARFRKRGRVTQDTGEKNT